MKIKVTPFIFSAALIAGIAVHIQAAESPVTVVEYRSTTLDAYFITGRVAEQTILDASSAFTRTGMSFSATPISAATSALGKVCRFYIGITSPYVSSHFYGTQGSTNQTYDCEWFQSNTPSGFSYEGYDFAAALPVGGLCASGSTPVYRGFRSLKSPNDGKTSNHRYSVSSASYALAAAAGYVGEGAQLCVTSATDVATVPGAPTGLIATPGSTSASIAFTAPASTGGAAITSYTATCTATGVSRTTNAPSSPIIVAALNNGTIYSCSVAATNAAGTGASSSTVSVTPVASALGYNTLWIPPIFSGTTSGGTKAFDLTLAAATKPLQAGALTNTYGYNGNSFWGPTMVMTQGELVRFKLQNNLPESTTTHWHGLLVPGVVDGGPQRLIAAGSSWTTDTFTVKNKAAMYWYHPHLHEATQKQMTLGAGGFIIVKDAEEAALNLPRTYGIDDIPLMLTSRRFTTLNGAANQLQYTATAYGDVMLTNGVIDAEVTLPKQYVRLRILNAEIERDYNLGFSDNRTFYVIGNDGGLLGAPVPVTRLIMAPGERYEIMVNLSGDRIGASLDLKSYNGADSGLNFGFAGLENANRGEFGSLLNYTTFNVLHINVGAATVSTTAVTALPSTLASNAFPSAANVTKSRSLVVTAGGPAGFFTFDNLTYSAATINQSVTKGATESWTINGGAVFSHSFHIHGVQFKIVARNGSATAINSYEQGWKDTIYVPIRESVTFIAKFDDAADTSYPYMYHCHMSNHEDEGLMGQFVVQ